MFSQSIHLAAVACIFVAAIGAPAIGLGQTTDQVSPQRGPWRASFTQMNQEAADAQVAADAAPSKNGGPDAQWRPADVAITGAVGSAGSGAKRHDANVAGQTAPTQNRSTGRTDNSRDAQQANGEPVPANAIGSRVTRSMDRLPNDAGQVWREYDISPYTSKIQSVSAPQQALLDWVLRETGTEMWFNQPLGILHATKSRLIVYHTPEIQTAVKAIVDRFVRTRGQLQSFNVSLVTVGSPNWRAQAYPFLQTVEVQSPGVEAWLISKENAALLFNQLKNRGDFKEQSSGMVNSHDGQSFTLERTKPVPFVRSLRWTPGQFPGYEPLLTTINEGYTVAISPLMTLDNRSVEVVVKCDVDQVEALTPVKVPVGGPNNTVQQVDLNVPKVVSWRLHERFRWPADQVLLLSSGVVADPAPESAAGIGALRSLALGAARQNRSRSDALLLIEYRGPTAGATLPRSAGRSRLQPLNR